MASAYYYITLFLAGQLSLIRDDGIDPTVVSPAAKIITFYSNMRIA